MVAFNLFSLQVDLYGQIIDNIFVELTESQEEDSDDTGNQIPTAEEELKIDRYLPSGISIGGNPDIFSNSINIEQSFLINFFREIPLPPPEQTA